MFQPNRPQWVTIVVTFVFATISVSDGSGTVAFFVITGALIVWWLEGRRQKRNELQQRTRHPTETDEEAADSDISPIVARALELSDVGKAHIDSLREAADQGDADAQVDLGETYASGRVVLQNYVEAVGWYRKAADQGDAVAQFNLGVMYANGHGVPQDYVEAHTWRNLAASRATGDEQKRYAEARDALAKQMTPAQVADAQQRASEWQEAFEKRQAEESELLWSSDPGPAERHLQRRNGNVLFSPERRTVTQTEIDIAQRNDQEELLELLNDWRQLGNKITNSPDTMTTAEFKPLLDECADIKDRVTSNASTEASKYGVAADELKESICSDLKLALAGNEEALAKFDKWKEAAAKGAELRSFAVLESLQVPADDVVATVCSFTPEDMEKALSAMVSRDGAGAFSAACTQLLQRAVSNGYASEEAAARLRVLGRYQG